MGIDQPDFCTPTLGPISKESRLAWRSILSNNGATPGWDNPIDNWRQGKFFPRGCRGFIESIEVYCQNGGVVPGTVYVEISPQPYMGYVWGGTIVIPAGGAEAWRSVTVRRMWNYDSLFVWARGSNANVQLGVDGGVPRDGFASSDAGTTWQQWPWRFWYRVNFFGETAGDVPVSGTLNIIEIPSVAAARQYIGLNNIPAGTEVYDTLQVGSGETLIVLFGATGDANATWLRPRIRCEGQQILPFEHGIIGWHDYCIDLPTPGIAIGKYDAVNHYYTLVVAIPIPFRRSLEVGFYNGDAVPHSGWVGYTYKTIR